ncbi:ribonuclease 3-like protein 1 [Rutidosis leptorrhynchoides]|uniref:ribonuclease 3-like protein 1 n=1 Tax=Rutidosis leptorrhynchoides TaxID=125765 RepID=UPI003A99D966
MMNQVPLPQPATAGDDADDDNRSSNHSALPLSLGSPSINSSSSAIPQGPVKLTSRSSLYEICAKSHWKRPVFACYDEEGPSNHRLFTYKVIVEMKESSRSTTTIECIGERHKNKKSAADSAAEGALWYLARIGYPKKPSHSKKSR